MNNKKLIKMLKLALIGPILFWSIFLGFDIGFPKSGSMAEGIFDGFNPGLPESGREIFVVFNLTLFSYVFAMILFSLCFYTKKERNVDKLLGDKSSVDDATFNLLHAIENEIEPKDDFRPGYPADLLVQILKAEIEKAKTAGASNKLIAEYLQQEIDSWIKGTLRVASDFETYTHIIDELNQ